MNPGILNHQAIGAWHCLACGFLHFFYKRCLKKKTTSAQTPTGSGHARLLGSWRATGHDESLRANNASKCVGIFDSDQPLTVRLIVSNMRT